jgi:hypothetical protein
LLDLNDNERLVEIFEYLATQGMSMHLIRMHVRINFKHLNELNYSGESKERKYSNHNRQQQQKQQHQQQQQQQHLKSQQLLYDYAASAEQTLKIRVCKSFIPIIKSNEPGQANYSAYAHNESSLLSSFELALADEQVFTYFINNIDQNKQCLSIVISNMIIENGGNNFSYCIELNKCDDRLPFVCKFETNKTKEREKMTAAGSSKSKQVDSSNFIFPDTLQGYIQDPKMSYVMNSFLALVHGLNRVHQAVIFSRLLLNLFLSFLYFLLISIITKKKKKKIIIT